MNKIYYKKSSQDYLKTIFRITSAVLLIGGIGIAVYIFLPFISWQIYFKPVFATHTITTPIPKSILVNTSVIKDLISYAQNSIEGVNYLKAENWFPSISENMFQKGAPKISYYTLSIPKIKIQSATVSAIDTNVGMHLVNYPGTSIPGDFGNSVVFGHSTLPQLFNPNDYKTILANAYKLKTGDKITASINGVAYTYKIYNIRVVDPTNTSLFEQSFNNSYLTLVTCTPPGTVWKRLLVKAKLEKI